MLSSVLNSDRAVQVNIQIMRAFVNLRREALNLIGLKKRVEAIEKKYDVQFRVVFEAIKKLLEPETLQEQNILPVYAVMVEDQDSVETNQSLELILDYHIL